VVSLHLCLEDTGKNEKKIWLILLLHAKENWAMYWADSEVDPSLSGCPAVQQDDGNDLPGKAQYQYRMELMRAPAGKEKRLLLMAGRNRYIYICRFLGMCKYERLIMRLTRRKQCGTMLSVIFKLTCTLLNCRSTSESCAPICLF
jgi:hypothetical protein